MIRPLAVLILAFALCSCDEGSSGTTSQPSVPDNDTVSAQPVAQPTVLADPASIPGTFYNGTDGDNFHSAWRCKVGEGEIFLIFGDTMKGVILVGDIGSYFTFSVSGDSVQMDLIESREVMQLTSVSFTGDYSFSANLHFAAGSAEEGISCALVDTNGNPV